MQSTFAIEVMDYVMLKHLLISSSVQSKHIWTSLMTIEGIENAGLKEDNNRRVSDKISDANAMSHWCQKSPVDIQAGLPCHACREDYFKSWSLFIICLHGSRRARTHSEIPQTCNQLSRWNQCGVFLLDFAMYYAKRLLCWLVWIGFKGNKVYPWQCYYYEKQDGFFPFIATFIQKNFKTYFQKTLLL